MRLYYLAGGKNRLLKKEFHTTCDGHGKLVSDKAAAILSPTETIECPLCLGEGQLKRTEILDRLGVRDFARVAQLSAEEAFRLLSMKHTNDHQSAWSRFETELAKRTAEIEQRYRDELRTVGGKIKELESAARVAEELHALDVQLGHADSEARLLTAQSQKEDLSRRVEDCLREVAELRKRNQELETEMSKVARVGRLEELSFADEARTWAGVCVSEKLARNGDFILAYRDTSGAPLEPRIIVDNKDKSIVTEGDVKKLIRDAKERRITVGIIVAREESQLRQVDRERRWRQEDGVWILRTTRQWLPRDLEVLKPLFERMRTEGPNFLQRNSALAEEICRTFVDLDEVEKELKRAAKAIDTASGLTTKYKTRLQALCDNAAPRTPERDLDDGCQTRRVV
jgi:phage host-nuclease inhibitor protein Gam